MQTMSIKEAEQCVCNLKVIFFVLEHLSSSRVTVLFCLPV